MIYLDRQVDLVSFDSVLECPFAQVENIKKDIRLLFSKTLSVWETVGRQWTHAKYVIRTLLITKQ